MAFWTTRRAFSVGLCSAGATLLAGTMADATAWPGGARGAVSLTYDDGYDSHLDHVVPLLSRLGLRATFFLTVENVDERIAEWVTAWRSGQEIGNHTLSHPCQLASYSTDRYLKEEIFPSERYLDAHFPGSWPRPFAYPCGETRLGTGPQAVANYLNIVRPRFLAARTVWGRPNSQQQAVADPYMLSALVPSSRHGGLDEVAQYLDLTVKTSGWAVLVFHDVAPRPTEGDIDRQAHLRVLGEVKKRSLWCAPVGTVINYLSEKGRSGTDLRLASTAGSFS